MRRFDEFDAPGKHDLRENEIEEIAQGTVLASTVEACQMPHGGTMPADSPERSLCRAILFDAIECATRHLHSHIPSQRKAANEALEWILADDEQWFLSFIPLCNSLRIDPEYMRRLTLSRIEEREEVMASAEAA